LSPRYSYPSTARQNGITAPYVVEVVDAELAALINPDDPDPELGCRTAC
jgi:hypothetical protein